MDKRAFLKASGALITGGVLSHLAAEDEQKSVRTNWAGNYQYSARQLYVPKTAEEVQALIKRCHTIKALGARHSFNAIADSRENQISLENLKQMTLDRASGTAIVGAGVRYGQLAPYLDKEGFALHNLASLPHVSVVGACATATHGSGVKNGNLATAVSMIEMVNGNGETVVLSRGRDEHFPGVVVGLGALGVVTKIGLAVQPRYEMRQFVYENLPLGQLEKHFDEIFSSGYSVSLFTNWQNHRISQVWIKRRVDQNAAPELGPELYGARRATSNLHPIPGYSAENCTQQMGVAGPWFERLPHFRMNFTPSSGNELQTEYFVARNHGYEAIQAVERLRDQITPHLFISELRAIEADDLWMSPCYKRSSMTIHFTWKPEWPAVKKVLPAIEEQLAPFDARPHWAKLFTMAPSRLQSLYPQFENFRMMLKQFDPSGKFRNEFLDRNIYGL